MQHIFSHIKDSRFSHARVFLDRNRVVLRTTLYCFHVVHLTAVIAEVERRITMDPRSTPSRKSRSNPLGGLKAQAFDFYQRIRSG